MRISESGTDSWIRTEIRIVTKIELIGPWAYPSRNFVKIRPQLFQLSDGQTDKQTDKQTEPETLEGFNCLLPLQ